MRCRRNAKRNDLPQKMIRRRRLGVAAEQFRRRKKDFAHHVEWNQSDVCGAAMQRSSSRIGITAEMKLAHRTCIAGLMQCATDDDQLLNEGRQLWKQIQRS